MIVWSLCCNVDQFPFSNKTRNWRQLYCGLLSWSCFCNGFHRSYVLFFNGRHRFFHVLINAIHDSDPRNGSVLKQRWNLNFDTVSIIMIATFFYVQDWCDPHILEHPSSYTGHLFILGINVASVVLLLKENYGSIVLVRQASNPHQNTIWEISGLLTNARIFARLLSLGFSTAVQW